MIKKTTAIFTALALVLLSGCGTRQQKYSASELTLFDTASVLTGYAQSQNEFDEVYAMVFGELEQYARLYDIYNEYEGVNNLKTLNDSAGGQAVAVDSRIIDLLLFSKEMYALTGGCVNVAMGSVLSLWHDCRETALAGEQVTLPDEQALLEAAQHTDIDNVIIDEQAGTVRLVDPEMSLDVGAIAKGYAAQQVMLLLERQGVTGYIMSIGGNVCPVGLKPDGAPWTVGLQNPYDTSEYFCTLSVENQCVVTSGSYQRYFELDGVRYCHIIDPETLMPAQLYSSVTVICADSALADALSTALFILPLEAGQKLIASTQGAQAIWILSESQAVYSDGARAFVNE